MNLHLSGHHLEITPSMREYLTGKLERINRHFDHVIDIDVILSVEKLEQKIEANARLRGKSIFVACHDPDMYAAIDGLVDKLDRQVIKYKETHTSRRVRGSGGAELAGGDVAGGDA